MAVSGASPATPRPHQRLQALAEMPAAAADMKRIDNDRHEQPMAGKAALTIRKPPFR
jgi:hypothetical protein